MDWKTCAEIRNRFCAHVTGVRDAQCVDEVCSADGNTSASFRCDLRTLESFSKEFELLRGSVHALAVPGRISKGNFECAEQLLAKDYGEFLMFINMPRLVRSDGPSSLFNAIHGSAEAVMRLTDLFLRVPGSNWVQWHGNEDFTRTTYPALVDFLLPSNEPFENLFVRKILETHSCFDIAVSIMDFLFPSLREKLLFVWSLSVAKNIVRFTDDELKVYNDALISGVREIDVSLKREVDSVPGEIASWMFNLVTRTSFLSQPPLMRSVYRNHVQRKNSMFPDVATWTTADAHWFTRPMVTALPGVAWDDPVTHEEFVELAHAFYEIDRQPEDMPGTVIMLRILYSIAKSRGWSGTPVFELIPPEWRDFVILFTPGQHHFFDGLVAVVSELSTIVDTTAVNVVIGARLLHQVGLEQIEVSSLASRYDYAHRAPFPTIPSFAVESLMASPVGNEDDAVKRVLASALAASVHALRVKFDQVMPPFGEAKYRSLSTVTHIYYLLELSYLLYSSAKI